MFCWVCPKADWNLLPYARQIRAISARIALLPKQQVVRRPNRRCVQLLDSLGDKIVMLPEQQLVSVAKIVLLLEK